MTTFQMFYPSLGSSYTPNLSTSIRIQRFEKRFPDPAPVPAPTNDQKTILLAQLIEIINEDFTYNFTKKLIKNIKLSTSSLLVLSLELQYCNIIENVDITITTLKQITPDTTPYYVFDNATQTMNFYISSVYDNNNIMLNVSIIMKDGSTHIYNSSYFSENYTKPSITILN